MSYTSSKRRSSNGGRRSTRRKRVTRGEDIKHNLITIKYLADFNYFGCTEYSDDIINHITKLIYDASLNSEINIKLNQSILELEEDNKKLNEKNNELSKNNIESNNNEINKAIADDMVHFS